MKIVHAHRRARIRLEYINNVAVETERPTGQQYVVKVHATFEQTLSMHISRFTHRYTLRNIVSADDIIMITGVGA